MICPRRVNFRSRRDKRSNGITVTGNATRAISVSRQSMTNATTTSTASEVKSFITEATASVSALRNSSTSFVMRESSVAVGVRL